MQNTTDNPALYTTPAIMALQIILDNIGEIKDPDAFFEAAHKVVNNQCCNGLTIVTLIDLVDSFYNKFKQSQWAAKDLIQKTYELFKTIATKIILTPTTSIQMLNTIEKMQGSSSKMLNDIAEAITKTAVYGVAGRKSEFVKILETIDKTYYPLLLLSKIYLPFTERQMKIVLNAIRPLNSEQTFNIVECFTYNKCLSSTYIAKIMNELCIKDKDPEVITHILSNFAENSNQNISSLLMVGKLATFYLSDQTTNSKAFYSGKELVHHIVLQQIKASSDNDTKILRTCKKILGISSAKAKPNPPLVRYRPTAREILCFVGVQPAITKRTTRQPSQKTQTRRNATTNRRTQGSTAKDMDTRLAAATRAINLLSKKQTRQKQ